MTLPIGQFGINIESGDVLLFPTSIIKSRGEWLIVDNGNSRLLATKSLLVPKFRFVLGDLIRPHTVRCVGDLTIVDDTDRNSIKINTYGSAEWREFKLNGARPHHIEIIDSRVFVLCSNSQTMHVFDVLKNDLHLAAEFALPFLEKTYTRTFHVAGDRVFFVPGPGRIIECQLAGLKITPINQHRIPYREASGTFFYKVPQQSLYYLGMIPNDYHSDDGSLICSDTPNFKSYQTLNGRLKIEGTPYSMTQLGHNCFLITTLFKTSQIIFAARLGRAWFSKPLIESPLPKSGWRFEGRF